MADLTLRLVKGSPLTNAEVDANFINLNEAITIGGEPMGHEDRAQSTLSFNASTRTVTVAPVSGSFTVWVKGNKFVFTIAQTVVIPNTTGLHYVYFNTSGVLSSHMTYFDWPNEAPTAYVAWNATTGAAPFFGDERHGVTLDWQTHEYLHRTRGAALANGFSISNYTVAGTGAADADAQLDLSGGTFFDEDLQVDIVSSNTPTANTWEQDLAGPAQIPVLYRSGTGWVRDNPTNFVLKAGTATPRYNTESGGVWGLTDVPNNSYSAVWVIATNNLTYPVVAIMGQGVDNNAAQAENFDWSGLNLDGFPAIEFRPLYKIIFQCSSGYTNTIKARFTNVFDIRNLVSASPAATIGSSHGGLSGLGADDHLQYIHVTEVRSPSAAVKNSFLPAQTGQVGKFLTTDGTNPSWATMTAPNNGTLTLAVSGTGLSGSASFTANQAGGSTFTVTSNATSANTAGAIVARDGSGNFSANVITAVSFSGSASGLTGLKTVNGNSILGSGNIQIDGGVTSFNTRTGAITLSSGDVTTALGFTPYNATNPSGFTTNVGTVTGVTAGTGLTGGTVTSSGTIALATSGVTAGTYTKLTVDVYGRATVGALLSSSDVTTALGFTPYNATNPSAYITASASITGSAATLTTGRTIALTGDVTYTSGSFNGSANVTGTATLAASGVTAGTYTKVTVDAKGRVTVGASLAAGDVPTLNQNTTGSAATLTTGRTIALTGDVTYTSGSFNGSANVTGTATLANSGVTAGTYTKVTVNAKGLTTSGTTLAASDIPELTMAKLPGAAYKQSVRCATTANITLSGTQTIDGIAVVANDRVLVKNQTTASQNGIYIVAAGAWTRSLDADAVDEIGAAVVNVDSGTENGGELWTTTFKTADTLGTTAMNWYEVLYNTGSWGISITGSSASTTGNAATATALQTARTINGVSFNGSANITVADSTKLPLSGGTLTGAITAPTYYSSGTTYYMQPATGLSGTTAGSRFNDLRFDSLWQGVPAANGPILTYTLTSAGSGYVDGSHTGKILSGGSGVYATFDFVVTGGVITTATLTERGSGFAANDTISIAASVLGGTGSGGLITVNTVRSVDVSLYAAAPRIRLGSNDTSLTAGQEIGGIYFNTRDGSVGGADDTAYMLAVAEGTSGGGGFEFWTSANGGTATRALAIAGNNSVRFYDSTSTFYHSFSSTLTANRALVFPDAAGTVALTSSSITGNAATATTLQTARTINGVSFNGSANITVADSTKLPLAGGTMTGAITFAAGQTWPTFNQSTTGSAATATTLSTNATISGLNFGGVLALTGSGATTGNTTGARMTESYGPQWNLSNSATWHYQILNGSLLAGLAANGGNYGGGNIYATGNITAYYSDERLKTSLGRIENALEKVRQLEGFRYVNNDLAKGFGFTKEEPQLGLSAQAAQRVAPETVSLAPFDMTSDPESGGRVYSKSGEHYLTVQYDRLVPLLVEAIKEQDDQVVEMAKEVVELRANLVKLEALVSKLIEG